jgi:hypothetical protein
MLTQKAIKEAKKIRTVLPPEMILASVKIQDNQDKALTKSLIENLKVIEETL